MCPEESLLSAFADGEVPSPWRERMGAHIASCPRCSARVERYREISRLLAAPLPPAGESALASARARIAVSIDPVASFPARALGLEGKILHLMRERVPLPVPFIAAAAAAILFLLGASLGLFAPSQHGALTLASASKTISAQSATIEWMARYMKENSAEPVMIEMPQGSEYSQLGNPVIMSSPGIVPVDEGGSR